MSSTRSRANEIVRAVAPTLVVFLVVEALLRTTGLAPAGHFDFLLPTASGGLYPPNATIENDWGPIPYVLRTNEFGLRDTAAAGPRIGAQRLVTIGDSIIDGFFVDDDGTIQHFLQQALDRTFDGRYEVFNAARGGGSIAKELAILKEIALELRPELVILGFVTNDIAELRGKTRRELADHPLLLHRENLSSIRVAGLWFFSRTAVGEVIFRLYWRLFVSGGSPQVVEAHDGGDARYSIRGGMDFEENAEQFRRRYFMTDGIVLAERFSGETRTLLANYLDVLAEFAAICHANGIVPVFVYYPSYTQIYDPSTPTTIREVLRDNTSKLSMPFLDLTGPLRDGGRERVLHLAPVDYHPNPDGNEVIAEAIFAFLRERDLVR